MRIRSSVERISWPAIPGPMEGRLLGLNALLEESQWWPPDRLEEHQYGQASILLDYARKYSPFYASRIAGFDAGRPLTPELWRQIPILTRKEIQTAGQDLYCTRVPPDHGKPSPLLTSGSTGRPIQALTTRVTGLFWKAFTLRDHLWHDRDLSGKFAAIRMLKGHENKEDGIRSKNWGPTKAFETGPAVGLSITIPIERQVAWLRKEKPNYLLTYPTNALHLARHCLDHGLDLPGLREVETLAELLTPETRTLCRQAWGLGVVDMYSAQEAGYLALQCPDHTGEGQERYHVLSEGVLVEILDEKDGPCAPGQTGRVVVTALHNFAMPLIRYEIGDYAEAGAPCSCGRGLPVINRVVGRARSMLILPEGKKVYPIFSSSEFLAVAPIRQKQLIQRSESEIEIKLVADSPLSEEQEARLGGLLNERIGHTFSYRFTYLDEIPRSKGGKFEEVRVDFRSRRS